MRFAWAALCVLALAACDEGGSAPSTADEPVRAVQTVVTERQAPVRVRAFPSVLQPPEITRLSFEVGGRVGEVDLTIGQVVSAGEVLLSVDPRDFELRLAQAEAQLSEAESALRNARTEADRQTTLFQRNVVSEAARDQAITALEQAEARVEQAQRNADLTRESRGDTTLVAPFDGVVNTVDVQDFTNIEAGQTVLTLFRENGFQARVLVSYDVVSQIGVSDTVTVRPSDRSGDSFEATVTEVARRAEAVSAFPVVVTLNDPAPYLRSGMAVEVLVELPVASDRRGILLPLTALATHRIEALNPAPDAIARVGEVFVVDPQTDTVQSRTVTIAGATDSEFLVIEGLEEGERVVTAGVPFLREGQTVTLWEGHNV